MREIHLGIDYGKDHADDWRDFYVALFTSATPVFIRVDAPGTKFHDSIMEVTPRNVFGRPYPRNREISGIRIPDEYWRHEDGTRQVMAYFDHRAGFEYSLWRKNFVWLPDYTGPAVKKINDPKAPVHLVDGLGTPIVVGGLCVVGPVGPSFAVVSKIERGAVYVREFFGNASARFGNERRLAELGYLYMIVDDIKSKLMLKKLAVK